MSKRPLATLVSITLLLPVAMVWGLVAAVSVDAGSDDIQLELVRKTWGQHPHGGPVGQQNGHDDDDDGGRPDNDDDDDYPPKPDDDDDDGNGGGGGGDDDDDGDDRAAFTTQAGPTITVGMLGAVLLAGIGFIFFGRWLLMRRLQE
jgi:hypothetical protein